MTAIDEYLERFDGPTRASLDALRDALRAILPRAGEEIRYRMPSFVVAGKAVAGFDGFRNHCSYFPHSGSVLDHAGPFPDWCDADGGTLRFPIGRTLPKGVVRRLVAVRLAQLSAVDRGTRVDCYPDGGIKATGPMKDGELHGAWKWFRTDQSLMRSGRFDRGRRVGVWETWSASGALRSRTDLGR